MTEEHWPPLPPPPNPDKTPNFWAMFFLGILLLIGSCVGCGMIRGGSVAPFVLGSLVAFFTVFFDGYRGVFVGFLSTIGVVLLGIAVICGSGLVPAYHG